MAAEIDNDRLVKLLALTTSTNDNEALLAIRMANEMLARFNIDWRGLFLKKDNQQRQSAPPPPPPPKSGPSWYRNKDIFTTDSIEDMFDTVLYEAGYLSDSARDFLESLRAQYDRKGRLTPKQLEALEKFYNNRS